MRCAGACRRWRSSRECAPGFGRPSTASRGSRGERSPRGGDTRPRAGRRACASRGPARARRGPRPRRKRRTSRRAPDLLEHLGAEQGRAAGRPEDLVRLLLRVIGDARAHQAVGGDAQSVDLEAGGVEDVAPVGEAHLRRHGADLRIASGRVEHDRHGVRLHRRVVVEDRDPFAPSFGEPGYQTAREAFVALQRDEHGIWEEVAHQLGRPVVGAVVHNHQLGFSVHPGQCELQRAQAPAQQLAALVVNDDGRHRHGHSGQIVPCKRARSDGADARPIFNNYQVFPIWPV